MFWNLNQAPTTGAVVDCLLASRFAMAPIRPLTSNPYHFKCKKRKWLLCVGASRQAIDRSVMVHTQKYERFRKSNRESLVSISKTKTIALWAITLFTAAASGAAGIAKIIGTLDAMPLVSEMGRQRGWGVLSGQRS